MGRSLAGLRTLAGAAGPAIRTLGAIGALCAAFAAHAQPAAVAADRAGQRPSWGAIASTMRWHGYSFNHATRDAAERAARAQCERAAGRSGTCEVRTAFDRSCAALATGNYGEWGAAAAATTAAAAKGASAQCESHLPTEPCKVVVNVCSLR